LDDYTVT